jgi:hypothetical protein
LKGRWSKDIIQRRKETRTRVDIEK